MAREVDTAVMSYRDVRRVTEPGLGGRLARIPDRVIVPLAGIVGAAGDRRDEAVGRDLADSIGVVIGDVKTAVGTNRHVRWIGEPRIYGRAAVSNIDRIVWSLSRAGYGFDDPVGTDAANGAIGGFGDEDTSVRARADSRRIMERGVALEGTVIARRRTCRLICGSRDPTRAKGRESATNELQRS